MSSTLCLEGQTKYFTVLDRRTIKLHKSKWIQSILIPTNALWKDLMWYCLKLILNSDQDLALSQQKQILTGLLVTKSYKNRTMKIYLFNYSMLDYILPMATSHPHIYRRNSCPTHIFEPTHQTGL